MLAGRDNDASGRGDRLEIVVGRLDLHGDRTVAQCGIGAERGEADSLTPITRGGCVAAGLGAEFRGRDGDIVGGEGELFRPQRGAVDRNLIEDSVERKTTAKRAQASAVWWRGAANGRDRSGSPSGLPSR